MLTSSPLFSLSLYEMGGEARGTLSAAAPPPPRNNIAADVFTSSPPPPAPPRPTLSRRSLVAPSTARSCRRPKRRCRPDPTAPSGSLAQSSSVLSLLSFSSCRPSRCLLRSGLQSGAPSTPVRPTTTPGGPPVSQPHPVLPSSHSPAVSSSSPSRTTSLPPPRPLLRLPHARPRRASSTVRFDECSIPRAGPRGRPSLRPPLIPGPTKSSSSSSSSRGRRRSSSRQPGRGRRDGDRRRLDDRRPPGAATDARPLLLLLLLLPPATRQRDHRRPSWSSSIA